MSSAATRALLVEQAGKIWRPAATSSDGARLSIGRTTDSDVPIDHPLVSREHATLELTAEGWWLTDLSSHHGTYVHGRRVSHLLLDGEVEVRLGDPESGAALHLSAPTAVHSPSTVVVRIGRAEDNTIVVADLEVDQHHAELVPDADRGCTGYLVTDLGSATGTFVDGAPVPRGGTARLPENGLLTVGRTHFTLRDGDLLERVDDGGVYVEARGLRTTAKARRGSDARTALLDDVSFTLGKGTLLAVLSPSRRGASALAAALSGARPAEGGEVLFDGRDLYGDYAELRHRIGRVPRDDPRRTPLPAPLTVRTALTYAARLRFPADTSGAERAQRVDEVIADLGLTGQTDVPVGSLSDGQRTLTSVGLELLTWPSLLVLEEPTAGLEPDEARSVVRVLRALADGGRTVVVTSSTPDLELDSWDRVLVLSPSGSVTYAGRPGELLTHVGERDLPSLFRTLERSPAGWPVPGERPPDSPALPPGRLPVWTQVLVLARRSLAVLAADHQRLAVLASLPLVLAVLARTVHTPLGLLVVLVVSAALLGAVTSVREVVVERRDYTRQRAVGLSPFAYLASKTAALGLVVTLQCLLLVALALAAHDLPETGVVLPWALPEIGLAVTGVAVASVCVGLAVSAAAPSIRWAAPTLALLLAGQLVLSGGLFPLGAHAPLEQLAWLAPPRWGLVMTAGTVHLPSLEPRAGFLDPLWTPSAHTWWLAAGINTALAIAASGLAYLLLRRREAD